MRPDDLETRLERSGLRGLAIHSLCRPNRSLQRGITNASDEREEECLELGARDMRLDGPVHLDVTEAGDEPPNVGPEPAEEFVYEDPEYVVGHKDPALRGEGAAKVECDVDHAHRWGIIQWPSASCISYPPSI